MQNKNVSLAERLLQETLKEAAHSVKPSELKILFLIKRPEIEEAIREGFGKKRIWKILNRDGEFPGSYSCFLKMVKKYIEEHQQAQSQQSQTQQAVQRKYLPKRKMRLFIRNPNR